MADPQATHRLWAHGALCAQKKQLPRYERPGFPGWWFQPTPLQNMEVSWDDEIPNIWEMHVPNHQPEMVSGQKKRHF